MSKVCLLNDTHWGCRNDGLSFLRYFDRFYTNVFFPYLEKNNITRIIHLGDFFDRRKFINYHTLSETRRIFLEPARKYEIDLIVGNHDVAFKQTNDLNSPDLLFRDYPNIKVHTSAAELVVDGVKLALLPWVCTDNYLESMEFLKQTQSQLLFAHLEIQGFEMHAGQISDTGFKENVFNKFDMVMTGHFHHKSTRGNIHYLGSPVEITWADYNDDRGFHIFDTDTRELTYIKNPYSVFKKIFYDDREPEVVEKLIASGMDDFHDTFTKIVIRHRTNQLLFDRLQETLESVKPVDVSIVDNTIDMLSDVDIDDEDIEDTPAIIRSVVATVEKQTVKDDLLPLMLRLHTEAVNISSI